MRLDEWVKTDERNQQQMADEVGVHFTTFSRWVSGKAIPAKRNIKALRKLTDDKVKLSDFYDPKQEYSNGHTTEE